MFRGAVESIKPPCNKFHARWFPLNLNLNNIEQDVIIFIIKEININSNPELSLLHKFAIENPQFKIINFQIHEKGYLPHFRRAKELKGTLVNSEN